MGKETSKKAFSIELCGGTHAARTGDIGYFKITQESALSSGIRRIEALTGDLAETYVDQLDDSLSAVAQLLKSPIQDLEKKVAALLEDRKKLEKALKSGGSTNQHLNVVAHDIHGHYVATLILEDTPPKDLKSLADTIKAKKPYDVLVLLSKAEGRGSMVVSVDPRHSGGVSAIDLVKIGAEAMGGAGGGGRPEMAQSGGPDGTKAEDAVKQALRYLERAFKA